MNEMDYSSTEVKKSTVGLVAVPEWLGSSSPEAKATWPEVSTSYGDRSTPSIKQPSTLLHPLGDEIPVALDPDHDEDYRHWSPLSQPYAPADVLLQYLRGGWQIQGRVLVEVSRCTSRRCTELYYFILTRDDERLTMPVLANPVVLRLAQELGLILVRVHTAFGNTYSRRVENDYQRTC